MPKRVLQVTNFSGGLNSYKDARDIEDEQFVQNWNAMVDQEGVIRVSGMAENYIQTDFHNNSNFQEGYGLFQFSTDYSFSNVSGDFTAGVTSGTLAASGSTTAHSLENKPSTATSDDIYNGWTMFITGGTKKGESRAITDYDYTGGSPERKITTEAFSGNLSSSSKYSIFRWATDGTNWSGSANKKDIFTNGVDENMETAHVASDKPDSYFVYTKKTGISDDQSTNLGYIEYKADSTGKTFILKPF